MRRDHDLDKELQFHVDQRVADLVSTGLTQDEARRRARLEFGGVQQVKEAIRDQSPWWFVGGLGHDLRFAARMLRSTPIVTTIAIVSLALGIGANTAIFSLVNSLFLRPLPVRNPEQLVLVADPSRGIDLPSTVPNLASFMWSYRMWDQIRQRPQLFDGAFGYFYSRFNLASGGETEFVEGLYASGRFFETLGVGAILGRTLTEADDQRDGGAAGAVAMISHGFWQHRFRGTADVVGRTLMVERVPFTIVGVLPQAFVDLVAGRTSDVVIPVGMASVLRGRGFLDSAGVNWITIMARLKPGQTLAAASAVLRGVQPQIREASLPSPPQNPDAYLTKPLTLLPAGRGNPLAPLRVRSERPLLTMQVAVGLVLVIACGNIANLALARAVARRHEMSVRLAVGASQWRLARQMIVESLLLASIGAAGGFLLAQWATRLLVQFFSTEPNAGALHLAPDARVLAFTAAIAVATALLFGIVPACGATRVEPIESLKEEGRRVLGSRLRLVNGFVIAQVALSLALVLGGGLLIRTYANLARMNLGFDPAGVLTVDVGMLKAHIPPSNRLIVFEEVRRAVATVPGVESAALADISPVAGGAMAGDVEVLGYPMTRGHQTFVNRVSPGWLSLYRTPLSSGRDFTVADRAGARRVAIVNRAFAREFLRGGDPLGRVIRQLHGPPGHAPIESEIVGVTGDAVYESVRAAVPPTTYFAFDQIDEDLLPIAAPVSASLSVRAAGLPAGTLTHSVAAAIATVNPNLDLTFRPLSDVVSASITLERALAILSGFFGGLSLLLAVVGIYGVTSYAVNRRRTEIGVRMALGATSATVLGQVLSRMLVLVAIGIVIGTAASLWASRFMGALLHGVAPHDPLTLIGAAVTLAAAGAVAGGIPAWQAAHIDPAEVLREG